MPQTILIDGCTLGKAHTGTGINRYLVNLLHEFESITAGAQGPGFEILVPSIAQCGSNGWAHRPGFAVSSHPLMRFHRAWKYGLVNSLTFQMRTRTLFLPMPVSVYFKPRRLAVTVHDIIPLIFPGQYRSMSGRIFLQTYTSSMARADLILTDSAYSKADMVSRFGVPEEKIVVACLGFDPDLFKPGPADDTRETLGVLSRSGISRPYVMHVGRGEPRKNLVRLVHAYDQLISRRRDLDLQLVLSGSLGWGYGPLLESLKKPSLRGKVVLTGPVPDNELAALYRGAACFAMPSLYEGFGLPALEAMASGTPLMSSNRSSLPEVAGEAALYFDPESIEEMSAAMERILTDSALRERLIKTGLERARQFSWQRCAQTTLAALRAL